MSVSSVEIGEVRQHTVEVVETRPTCTVEIGVNAATQVVEVGGVPLDSAPPSSTVEVTPGPAYAVEVNTTTSISELVEVGVVGTTGAPGLPGPVGPEGPQGLPGADVGYYATFGFASPATLWVMTHGQGYGVVVETVDQSGDPIEGNVRYVDPNTVEVDWFYPTAGEARVFR